jgi:hypothetical protein
MSAVASFFLLPVTTLAELRSAAVPKKRFFGGVTDGFYEFLDKHGKEVAQYSWSGFVLATLLPYLEQKKQIVLMKPDHDNLGAFLSKTRGASIFVFGSAQKDAALDKLSNGVFSSDEMRDYFNNFNASNEKDIGEAMLDGVKAIKSSLEQVGPSTVVLLIIG